MKTVNIYHGRDKAARKETEDEDAEKGMLSLGGYFRMQGFVSVSKASKMSMVTAKVSPKRLLEDDH